MPQSGGLEFEGCIEVLGRALPSGLATLAGDPRPWTGADSAGNRSCPGRTERHLIPLVKGKFHFKGLSPGNYTLKISPLGLLDPLPLSCGLPLEISRYRLNLGTDGTVNFYDTRGTLLSSRRKLTLSWLKFTPGEGTAVFKGLVKFPETAAVDLGKTPILLLTQVLRPGPPGTVYCFHWLGGMVKRGRKKIFSFAVPAGRFYDFRSWSVSWAVRPDLAQYNVSLELQPSRTTAMQFEAEKGVSISGKVSVPDHAKFRMDFGSDPAARGVCFVTFRVQDWRQHVVTDSGGHYAVKNIFPDRYAIAASYERTGRIFSAWPDNGQLTWLERGHNRTLNMRFQRWTDARMEINTPALPKDASDRSQAGIIGYRGGLPAPRGISLLDDCYTGFSLRLGFRGSWEHHDIAAPDGLLGKAGLILPPPNVAQARILPGRYDVFIVQTVTDPPFYSIRILAARKNILFNGSAGTVRLGGPDLPGGNAGLRGSIRVSGFPGLKVLRGASSMRELGALMLPQVDLYDDQGRYRGSAFAVFSGTKSGEALAASKRAVPGKQLKIPLTFQIGGLPAGEYTARVFAYGRRPGSFRVKLVANKFSWLDAG